MNEFQLHLYIERVRREQSLEAELVRINNLMIGTSKYPYADKARQREVVATSNQIFRALLAEKARQKIIQEVRQNNGSHTQNSGTSPADNAT